MNFQLSRRSFLQASLATAISQGLLGCSNSQVNLQILLLANSVPLQSIGDFRREIGKGSQVDFLSQTQLSQIFDFLLNLQGSKQSNPPKQKLFEQIFSKSKNYLGVSSLGSYWLSLAIAQNLLQPLKIEGLANWEKIPTLWQQLGQRDQQGNISKEGKIYGAPYRWGSTVIAYQSDKLEELGIEIKDWQDLWNPQLRERISLLDTPRETIGLTLKKLGYSYNTADLNTVDNLEAELSTLDQQVKLYTSDRYLEPLILGDTWVAVAWSNDILSLGTRYPQIKFVIPQSGTALWADLWVKPQTELAEAEFLGELSDRWINFCWSDKPAKQISLFTNGISPALLSMNPKDLPTDLQDNIFLNSEILNSDRSEFLLPQSSATQKQYRDLWLKVRNRE